MTKMTRTWIWLATCIIMTRAFIISGLETSRGQHQYDNRETARIMNYHHSPSMAFTQSSKLKMLQNVNMQQEARQEVPTSDSSRLHLRRRKPLPEITTQATKKPFQSFGPMHTNPKQGIRHEPAHGYGFNTRPKPYTHELTSKIQKEIIVQDPEDTFSHRKDTKLKHPLKSDVTVRKPTRPRYKFLQIIADIARTLVAVIKERLNKRKDVESRTFPLFGFLSFLMLLLNSILLIIQNININNNNNNNNNNNDDNNNNNNNNNDNNNTGKRLLHSSFFEDFNLEKVIGRIKDTSNWDS